MTHINLQDHSHLDLKKPQCQLALVSIILQGREPIACLTISQSNMFNGKNYVKHKHKSEHSRDYLQREPHLPIHVGLSKHNTTPQEAKNMVFGLSQISHKCHYLILMILLEKKKKKIGAQW